MSSDHFFNFGRALSTTASAMLNSQTMEDTILSYSSCYKKMLHDSITNSGGASTLIKAGRQGLSPFSSRNNAFQDLFHATSGRSYFKNGFSNNRTSFQLLSYISDDLLKDIPDGEGTEEKKLIETGEKSSKCKNPEIKNENNSLFQGFEASLPLISLNINGKERLKSNDIKSIKEFGSTTKLDTIDEEADFTEELVLPEGVDPDEINNSYSLKTLSKASKLITDNLDLLEIKKNLSASEIKELDVKIEKLEIMRNFAFKKVEKLEQNELFLEKHLMNIKERIDMIEEYMLDRDDGMDEMSDLADSPDNKSRVEKLDCHKIEKMKNDLDESSSSFTSLKSSIKHKQPNYSQANYEKKVQQHKLWSSRKTHPTLQQYYKPGTCITSFSSAHDDKVTCFDFDMPFGTLCSAGRMDPTIKVWDLSKKKHITSVPGHLATINCMQMDQYHTLITGSRDALLKMWDIQKAIDNSESPGVSDVCIHTFDSHIDEITALSFNGFNLVSGSQDKTIRQWDLNNGKCIQTLDISFTTGGKPSRPVIGSTLLSDNDTPIIEALQCYDAALATGTKDGIVRLWDMRSGRVVRTLEGHTHAITCLAFDSVNLITGSLDNSIRIWDLRTGALADIFVYENPVTSLQFDLGKIVAANLESKIKLYDRQQKKHWFCGGEEGTESVVEYIRYKDGYLVDGRANGDINAWAV